MSQTEERPHITLDISSMLSGDVRHIDIDEQLPVDASELLVGVAFTAPVRVVGSLDNSAGYIRLDASVIIDYDTECARCLKKIHRTLEIHLDKTVCASDTVEDENSDDVVLDYILVENNILDIEEAVSEQIILEFPFCDLCSEDCKGLCSKCGKDLNEGDCDCPKKEIDPRLEALQELLNQMKENDSADGGTIDI